MRFLITETFQFLSLAHIDILTYFSITKLAKTAKIRCGSHCYNIWHESVPEGDKFAVAYCVQMFLFRYLSVLSPDGCFAFRWRKQLNFQILKVWSSSWKGNCVVSSKVFYKCDSSVQDFMIKGVFRQSWSVLGTIPCLLQWAFKLSSRDLPMPYTKRDVFLHTSTPRKK